MHIIFVFYYFYYLPRSRNEGAALQLSGGWPTLEFLRGCTYAAPTRLLSLNLSSSAVSFFFFLWLLLLYYLLSLTRARVGNVFARGKATSVILLETVFESCRGLPLGCKRTGREGYRWRFCRVKGRRVAAKLGKWYAERIAKGIPIHYPNLQNTK